MHIEADPVLISDGEENGQTTDVTLTPLPLSPSTPTNISELNCKICKEVAVSDFIRCGNCRNAIHFLCTSLPAYQVYNFANSNRKYTCIHCTNENYTQIAHLTTDAALQEFHVKLENLEHIINLLQRENEILRGENVSKTNEIKLLKTSNQSNREQLEIQIEELKNRVINANHIAAEKKKEISRLKQTNLPNKTVSDTSLETPVTHRLDHTVTNLANDFEDFKRFISKEITTLKSSIENINQEKQHRNNEDANYQKSPQKLVSPNKNQQYINQQQIKRRPFPVVNQFPERQTVFKKMIPGPSTYSETVKSKRKVALLCDSIPKPISLYHMKKKLKDANIYKKCFPGVSSNHLNHHILPTLHEDQPDSVIIHVGINDLLNDVAINDLISNTEKIGRTCVEKGVKDVIVSGIVYSRRLKKEMIDEANKRLEELCLQNEFLFLQNNNIKVEDLCKDGLHLDKNGKIIFFDNICNFLDYFLHQVIIN